MRNSMSSIVMAAMLVSASPLMAGEQSNSFVVDPGTCKIIPLPATTGPIHIVASQFNRGGDPGVADVTLFYDKADNALVWISTDATASSVQHSTSLAGSHIASLDFGGGVDLQVHNLGHVQVCDAVSAIARGTLTFFW